MCQRVERRRGKKRPERSKSDPTLFCGVGRKKLTQGERKRERSPEDKKQSWKSSEPGGIGRPDE